MPLLLYTFCINAFRSLFFATTTFPKSGQDCAFKAHVLLELVYREESAASGVSAEIMGDSPGVPQEASTP